MQDPANQMPKLLNDGYQTIKSKHLQLHPIEMNVSKCVERPRVCFPRNREELQWHRLGGPQSASSAQCHENQTTICIAKQRHTDSKTGDENGGMERCFGGWLHLAVFGVGHYCGGFHRRTRSQNSGVQPLAS